MYMCQFIKVNSDLYALFPTYTTVYPQKINLRTLFFLYTVEHFTAVRNLLSSLITEECHYQNKRKLLSSYGRKPTLQNRLNKNKQKQWDNFRIKVADLLVWTLTLSQLLHGLFPYWAKAGAKRKH